MKLPELPEPKKYYFSAPGNDSLLTHSAAVFAYSEQQMHSYAKEYAAAQNAQLIEALRALFEEQNGVPLIRRQDEYQRAMNLAWSALKGQP